MIITFKRLAVITLPIVCLASCDPKDGAVLSRKPAAALPPDSRLPFDGAYSRESIEGQIAALDMIVLDCTFQGVNIKKTLPNQKFTIIRMSLMLYLADPKILERGNLILLPLWIKERVQRVFFTETIKALLADARTLRIRRGNPCGFLKDQDGKRIFIIPYKSPLFSKINEGDFPDSEITFDGITKGKAISEEMARLIYENDWKYDRRQ